MRIFYFMLVAIFIANCVCIESASANEPTVCDLTNRLSGSETSWTGDKSGEKGVNEYGDETYANTFASDNGVFVFNNSYSVGDDYDYWSGFAYTNTTDVETVYFNVSAIAGKGVTENSSAAYITAFVGVTPTITFSENSSFEQLGMYVTNATYTYLSMRDGDGYAKKFGGEDGTDPDWLKLTATGYNQNGEETGSAGFYLADFRPENASEKYLVNEWKWFDLSSLGAAITSVKFSMESSDNDDWGMKTPAYFCIDGLQGVQTTVSFENSDVDASTIYYAHGLLYIQGLEGAEVQVVNIAGAIVTTFVAGSDFEAVPLGFNKGIYVVQAVKDGNKTAVKINVR